MKTIATGSPAGSLEVPFVAVSEVQELPAAVVVVVAAVLPLAERAGVLAVLQGKLSNYFYNNENILCCTRDLVLPVSRPAPASQLVPDAPHPLNRGHTVYSTVYRTVYSKEYSTMYSVQCTHPLNRRHLTV